MEVVIGASEYGMNASLFDEAVADRGKTVVWRAGFRCSCTVRASAAPMNDCGACKGSGYVYQPPVSARILLQGIDTKRDILPAGVWESGDITASVPYLQRVITETTSGNLIDWEPHPMWDIGVGDTIYLPDSEQRASEVLLRGEPMYGRLADTLRHPAETIGRVLCLLASDPETGSVSYFSAGADGTDFTVDQAIGAVQWATDSTADYCLQGNKLDFNPNGASSPILTTGAQYSVTYTHRPTYIVYVQSPQPRDQDGQHMPKKVILRLRGVDQP